MTKPYKILFLCTGNSARSILCEYFIRRVAPGRFESYSAGAEPLGKVNPLVMYVLQERYKIDASAARSKSWAEYKDMQFDFVITVCDSARKKCPIWPGQPIIAHWGFTDPATFTGSDDEKLEQIGRVALQIQRRLDLFCSLPMEKMEWLKLADAIRDIGRKE